MKKQLKICFRCEGLSESKRTALIVSTICHLRRQPRGQQTAGLLAQGDKTG